MNWRFLSVILFMIISVLGNQLHSASKGKKPVVCDGPSSVVLNKTGKVGSAYAFRINNIHIPIENRGVLGSVSVDGLSSGEYDNRTFLFSGGFMMSGLADTGSPGLIGQELWANGVASASRIDDYMPGPISISSQADTQIYVVSKTDPAFGTAWQDWSSAVALGADFYDGDNDGNYNPVDKNSNGKWDTDEDKPDILGDLTAWCVYNDGVDGSQRHWAEMSPRGIEIQQTIWGYDLGGAYGDILFIRYRIISKGTGKYSGDMDSVYFGVWADADIGDYIDDMVGCDTMYSAGYCYNEGDDFTYGVNPPCFLMRFLEGPVAYIPGVTFQDNNSNGIYDDGIDVPLDTAFNVRGPSKGIISYPGARNEGIASMIQYVSSDPLRGDPQHASEARNYLRGRLKDGRLLNPCTDAYGVVYSQPCSTINPLYWYSGDPVTNIGWIYTSPGDIRSMQNTGPFRLQLDQPMDIIVGYVVGRGTDAKNSITVARNSSAVAQDIFDKNFSVPSATVETTVGLTNANLKIMCDGSMISATSINATIKTFSGSVVSTLPLFDDGTHGDESAGDQIFTNTANVSAYQGALSLDVSVTSSGGSTTEWLNIVRHITTTSFDIFEAVAADNLNNDGNVNPDETVRYVFTLMNNNPFGFDSIQITGTPNLNQKTLYIGSVGSPGIYVLNYNSANPNSYFDFYVPEGYSGSDISVTLIIEDNRDNIWYKELTFPVVPFSQNYSTLQPMGVANGEFSILITNPAQVKNHTYVIHGVDSIDALMTPGFTLEDSTDGTILLQNHPLPDEYGFNITPIDGFKIFKGSMEYVLRASSWDFSPVSNEWFKSVSSNYGYALPCGAYLAPSFDGQSHFAASGSTVARSQYNAVQVKFSQKTGYTDVNINGKYDIGEPYAFDTTNLDYCQKAYFYNRNLFGTQVLYSGFKWIPFRAYDLERGKRLNVVIYDNDRNGRWDIDSTAISSRNFAYIMESEYDSSGVTYDSTQGGLNLAPAFKSKTQIPSMWVLWMMKNELEPYGTQGELTLIPTYPISSRNGFTFNPTIVSVGHEKQLPRGFALEQNYPNPFNPSTTIRYTIPQRMKVTLKVFNLLGQEIATLENGIKPAGTYDIQFDGKQLSSGVYFYRIQAGKMLQTKKFVLLK